MPASITMSSATAPISRPVPRTSRRDWQRLFGTFPILHVQPGDKLYLYSAVFAPARLHTRIVHDWQWLQPGKGWQTPAARSG